MKKILQNDVETRSNRGHIMLYTELLLPKWRINVRMVHGTTVANGSGNFGQERLETRLIRHDERQSEETSLQNRSGLNDDHHAFENP